MLSLFLSPLSSVPNVTIGENFNFITVNKKPHPSYSTLKHTYIVCAFGIEMHWGHDWDGKKEA